jgi:hypothetical protein
MPTYPFTPEGQACLGRTNFHIEAERREESVKKSDLKKTFLLRVKLSAFNSPCESEKTS